MQGIRFHKLERFLQTGLIAFALFFQGYVAATHFHNDINFLAFGGLSGDPVAELHEAQGGKTQQDQGTNGNHPDDCQICQTLAFGSVSITPAPIVLSTPVQFVVIVDVVADEAGANVTVVSTHFPRGPPSSISHV